MRTVLYDWGGLNVWLFHAINDMRAPWLDSCMLLASHLGSHGHFAIYLAAMAVAGYLIAVRGGDAHAWLSALAVFSVGYLLEGQIIGVLKPWFDFPRPPLALAAGSVHVIGEAATHHSLPSGHAAFAMLLTASLWPLATWRARIGLASFALWVGLSRVSLGAHFPADVLAGFILSLIVVLPLQWLARHVRHAP